MDNYQIRQEIKQRRRALSEATYKAMSLSCFENLKCLLSQLEYQHIGIYVSFNQEVDTKPIIEYLWSLGKDVYVPKCKDKNKMDFYKIASWNELEIGNFGILEPKYCENKNNQLDILVIPLVGYNELGYRLGMGGGYYDRFIENYPIATIGLGYSFQKVVFLTHQHDLKCDYVVNEKTIISFK